MIPEKPRQTGRIFGRRKLQWQGRERCGVGEDMGQYGSMCLARTGHEERSCDLEIQEQECLFLLFVVRWGFGSDDGFILF